MSADGSGEEQNCSSKKVQIWIVPQPSMTPACLAALLARVRAFVSADFSPTWATECLVRASAYPGVVRAKLQLAAIIGGVAAGFFVLPAFLLLVLKLKSETLALV